MAINKTIAKERPRFEEDRIDANRVFKDEGFYPENSGTYHVHHRIDGRLFAVNVWDITKQTLGSVCTFYDPDYQFLNIETIMTIREIEFMKRVQEKYNNKLKYFYVNGNAPVNQRNVFKQAINPQEIMCPFTCKFVKLTDELKTNMATDKYFKFASEKIADFWYYDLDVMVDNSNIISLIIKAEDSEKDSFRNINEFEDSTKKAILIRIINLHKAIGDEILKDFLFEWEL